ncbi:MAG: hypothetical protein WD651_07140 [Acidimicrobiia bacterium]
MTKLRRTALLALLPLLLAACEIRLWMDVEMATAESGQVIITMGFDEELRGLVEGAGEASDLFTEIEDEAAEQGFDIEPFTDGEIEGVRVTKSFSSLAELNEILNNPPSMSPDSDEAVVNEVRFIDNGESIRFEGSVPDGGGDFEGIDPSQFLDVFEFDARVSVKFPGSVIEHNGELSERTVTWIFYDEGFDGIEMFAEAQKAGGGLSGVLILVVLLVLAVVGAIVYRIMSERKVDTVADPTIAETPLPPAPAPPAG